MTKKSETSMEKANKEFESIVKFMTMSGPIHELTKPSTKVRFLGWDINTCEMTISCPAERMEWARNILHIPSIKIGIKLVRSVVGVEILSKCVTFLESAIGMVIKTFGSNGEERGSMTRSSNAGFTPILFTLQSCSKIGMAQQAFMLLCQWIQYR